MNKKRLLALVAVAMLIVLSGWYYWQRSDGDENVLVLYGNVDIRQVALAFSGSERIVEMHMEEGDSVQAGQVLATLDTRTLKLQIARSQAQIEAQEQILLRLRNGSRPQEIDQARAMAQAAKAQVDLAAIQLNRLKKIRDQSAGGRAISQQDLDNAQSQWRVARAQWEEREKALSLAQIGPRDEDIAQAEAQLQMARAELGLLQHHLAEAELKAPQNAVVRSRLREPGDMASPQQPVYTLAIIDPKWIRAYVNEPQLSRIRPGMPALVTTDSYPDDPLTGQIGYISDVAEFTPKSVQTEDLRTKLVYEVRILIQDRENRLRLGMPATVTVDLRQDRAQAGIDP